ncbi:MAG: glycosyltransferase family 2 protein [Rudaea sp.]
MDIVRDLTSIVIVAADSGADLAVCIECALGSSVAVEIIVSDNATRDGSVDAIAARWHDDSRVRLVRNGKNLGFGAGCNRGTAIAHGDALLFLNPDCRIETDIVARLRARLVDGIGLVGAAIVGSNGEPEPASRRRDPLLRRAVLSMAGLARLGARWPALRGIDLPIAADVQEVDIVSGALMLLPRTAFERIGSFDEGYFLHCEDMDLCRRVRDAGLRVVCANDVRVMHAKGTSSRSRPFFVALHKHRGMWRWFVKFDPAARNPVLRGMVWCGLWVHYVLLAPRYAWQVLRQR